MGLLRKRPETVLKSTYETAILERDAFEKEVTRLQEQVADLMGKYTALGFDEALVRRLAQKAIALLRKINDLGENRKVTVAVRKEMTTVLAEAQAAGLMEEKGAGHVEENPAPVETTPG